MDRATDRAGTVGRRVLAVLLVVSAVLHAVAVVRFWPSITSVVAAVLVLAALATAFVVPVRRLPGDLLAAIVVGAAGVLTFLVTTLVALNGGSPPASVLDARSVGGVLVDAVVARLAGITLRREARPDAPPR